MLSISTTKQGNNAFKYTIIIKNISKLIIPFNTEITLNHVILPIEFYTNDIWVGILILYNWKKI